VKSFSASSFSILCCAKFTEPAVTVGSGVNYSTDQEFKWLTQYCCMYTSSTLVTCETHAQNITVKETKWTLDKTYNAGTQDYTHWRQSGLWVQHNAATLIGDKVDSGYSTMLPHSGPYVQSRKTWGPGSHAGRMQGSIQTFSGYIP